MPDTPYLETLPLCRYVCCGRDTWCNSLRFEMFLLSVINSLLTSIRCLAKNWQGGIFSAPFWSLCEKLFLSYLYFNKILLHKSSKWSSLVSGPRSKFSPLETKNTGLVHCSQPQPFTGNWQTMAWWLCR